MSKIDVYRDKLKETKDWDSYLLAESGLPGKRANLELAFAVAIEGNKEQFKRFISFDAKKAPPNSKEEFLAFCGVLGQGKLLAKGNTEALSILRFFASDPRWRIREAVAHALQRWGKDDMESLIKEMEKWSKGNLLEKRASLAALCEPGLLNKEKQIIKVLKILDRVTEAIKSITNRQSDEFKALKKGLSYCWSVAAAALPQEGKRKMEKWFETQDKDVLWVMKENLKKKRLERIDIDWVKASRNRLSK